MFHELLFLQQKGWYAAMVEAQQKAQDWKISSD